jgi:Ca2+-binding RTX toxin-like protein
MPFNLDWASIGANGSYTVLDGADSLGLSVVTTTSTAGQTAAAQTLGTPAAAGLWVSGLTEPVVSTLTFAAPVANFSFEIYNLEQMAGGWDDRLTVLVTDAQGNVQAVDFGDLLVDPNHSAAGNVLNADGMSSAGVDTSGAADSVAVTIPGPVSQIQFIFDNGESEPVSGSFGIGNIAFDRADLDFVVEGTAGDDLIDDAYLLDPEGDRVDANDAADGSQDDVIQAGAGNDRVTAGAGDDFAVGDTGDDTLVGGDGDDTLIGDFETDSDFAVRGSPLAGPGGADVLYGGLGDDSLYGGSGDDSLYGGDGDDSLLGGHGDDLIEGGAGNDDLEGLYGDDTIYGGDGDDHVFGRDGADLIFGGDGVDSLIGSIGIDTLYGGAGNDILAGSQGSDLIYGGTGDDLVYIGVPAPGDVAYDSEGTVYLDEGNDFLDAGDATLRFEAFGGEGNDYMTAGVGDDSLFGGSGDDKIFGGAGNDQITGDAGNDSLDGQSGDDTFFLADGYGRDAIIGGEIGESSGDTLDASALTTDSVLDLGAGDAGNPEDGTLTVDPTGGGGAGAGIHYVNVFKPSVAIATTGAFPTGAIDFSQGEWFYVPVSDLDLVLGDAEGGDTSQSFAADFDGLSVAGNGIGSSGKAEYLDASGNPFFAGWISTDYDGATGVPATTYLIVTDAGGAPPSGIATSTGLRDDSADVDYSSFTTPIEVASFTQIEQFTLGSGNDSVIGSSGADVVSTGAGADTVDGNAGADRFDLGAGDGATDTVVMADGDGNDTISGFEAPIDNGDGSFTSRDLLDVSDLTSDGTTPVTVRDVVVTDTNGDGTGDAILTFPGGESLTLVGVLAAQVSSPSELAALGIPRAAADDIVEGSASADRIDLGYTGDPEGERVDANDNAAGNNNDDIRAGAGDDTVLAGLGDDTVDAGTGDDFVAGGAGDDSLSGGAGNDTLDGGGGDDQMFGGAGSDLFSLSDGFGSDRIVGGESGGDDDNITLGGLTRGVSVTYSGDEAGTIAAGPDSATFSEIESLSLTDSDDTVDGSGDSTGVNLRAGSGDDNLTGGAGADTLLGEAGDDTLRGGDGADQLFGGDGSDLFFGGSGDTIDGGAGFDRLNLRGLGGDTGTNVLYGGGDDTSGTVEVLDGSGAVTGSFSFTSIESVVPCFTQGSIILTNKGEKRVEDLVVGDRVLTRDSGFQAIKWVGARSLTRDDMVAQPAFSPISIRAGALGGGLPERDMMVSPQHRMLMSGPRAEMLFGEAEVLVAAVHLVNDSTILRARPQAVTYIHLLFDQHEIICADGAWSESFQPGHQTLQGMYSAQRDEVLALFPSLSQGIPYAAARLTLKSFEAKVLMKH